MGWDQSINLDIYSTYGEMESPPLFYTALHCLSVFLPKFFFFFPSSFFCHQAPPFFATCLTAPRHVLYVQYFFTPLYSNNKLLSLGTKLFSSKFSIFFSFLSFFHTNRPTLLLLLQSFALHFGHVGGRCPWESAIIHQVRKHNSPKICPQGSFTGFSGIISIWTWNGFFSVSE